ncbi:helix-turn-helix domain-containing protein [Phycicoccus flavus]|uniref:helix-turn-helix domain-containing protein n=1 Tax=Phycicoccus flavus TaxID=2502783 RepID=UPI000FEB8F50|nr:helix-turn-helix domain-containing protein [Phycicoccus flavus]NHA69973.1 helix-turn-helix domain-containing protein [Phycicoccus flavus]
MLAARRRLDTVDERRLIWQLHQDGESQQAIAAAAGVSQAHVSRTLALVRDHLELLEETPLELTRRAAVGQLPRKEMLQRLRSWHWTFGQTHGDAWEPGSWDGMTQAVAEGTLTPDEYERVHAAAVRGRSAGR